MNRPLQLISLGAGVQSSCMALMASAGNITPMPDAAIFADTQDEPASVYKWLDWLEPRLAFPVHRVTKGSLSDTCLKIRQKKDGSGSWAKTAVPAFIANPDGTRGLIQRQCTYDFKVMELIKAAKKLVRERDATDLSIAKERFRWDEIRAVQWIGISLDEVYRMKPSREKWISHLWPLVDARMTRHDCLRWMEARGFPKPPRSACVYCPYHSDSEWRRLRDEEPEAFAKAVKFDNDYRATKIATKNINGLPYLHSSLKPLGEVDFSTDTERGQGMLSGFGNDCEGMCGV